MNVPDAKLPQLMQEREIERLTNEIEVLTAKIKAINERDFLVVKEINNHNLYSPDTFRIEQYVGCHWTTVATVHNKTDIQPVLDALKAARGMTA